MATEIERKFLVTGDDWRRHVTERRHLRQAYLHAGDHSAVRIRIDGVDKAFLTIKSATAGATRNEYEYEIPVADAQEMLLLRVGSIVEKVRHIVPAGALRWEIDEFEGDNAGLVLGEIELPLADQHVALPSWIGREVTNDLRYYNASLAIQPYAHWRREGPEAPE